MHRLLYFDAAAGLTVGALVLSLRGWLTELYGLPAGLVVFLGVANLLYGCCSLPLALWARRPATLVGLLALANVAWAPVCLAMLAAFGERASLFGALTLLAEAGFVGGLGVIEWRFRHLLGRRGA